MISEITRKERYLNRKIRLLEEFGVKITPDIIERLNSLYPNDVMVENYTRKLISRKLGDY